MASDHGAIYSNFVVGKLAELKDDDFTTPVVHKDYVVFYKMESIWTSVDSFVSQDAQKEAIKVTANKVALTDLSIWTSVDYQKYTSTFTLEWRENGEKRTCAIAIMNDLLESKDNVPYIIDTLIGDAIKVNGYPPQIHTWMRERLKVSKYASGVYGGNKGGLIKNALLYSIGFPSTPPNPNHPSELAKQLPGIETRVSLPCPKDCDWHEKYGGKSTIRLTVIHLNDYHAWSREKIADWLDLLQERDGIDLTFKVEPDKIEDEKAQDTLSSEWKNVGYTYKPIINSPADILKGINPA